MSNAYDKIAGALVIILRASPLAFIVLTFTVSFSYLLLKQPQLSQFFLELMNRDRLPLFVMIAAFGIIMATMANQITRLRLDNEELKAEAQLCYREQGCMRTAIISLAMASTGAARAQEIIDEMDTHLDRVRLEASATFVKRDGGPMPGGKRKDDPPAEETL